MKGILILVLIALLVLLYYSGGIELNEGRLSFNYQKSVEKLSATYYHIAGELSKAASGIAGNFSKPPPDYELQVTEVRYLKDCIEMTIDTKESCLLVNLEMVNNHSERIDFEMIGKAIVTKDGRQLERYGGLYNTKDLSGLCDTDVLYKVFPKARTVTGMCFPLVGRSDEPVLHVKMSANGKWKEHSFDLMPYIS
ncbi:MAG: hypothetical protein OIN66_03345 [Candidatus Methanoperedens sp.]|nr:hypothetical protein [Candidatus Methanoperedens sp.]